MDAFEHILGRYTKQEASEATLTACQVDQLQLADDVRGSVRTRQVLLLHDESENAV